MFLSLSDLLRKNEIRNESNKYVAAPEPQPQPVLVAIHVRCSQSMGTWTWAREHITRSDFSAKCNLRSVIRFLQTKDEVLLTSIPWWAKRRVKTLLAMIVYKNGVEKLNSLASDHMIHAFNEAYSSDRLVFMSTYIIVVCFPLHSRPLSSIIKYLSYPLLILWWISAIIRPFVFKNELHFVTCTSREHRT